MNTLEVKNLYKEIKGTVVLSNINLSLIGGKVYAFRGENGSGKTMLFRVLSGLSAPTKGVVIYNKVQGNKKRCLHRIGVVIENASLFPQFTAFQNLEYLAKINDYVGKPEIEEALLRVGLDPYDKRVVRKFSLGMKQRLLIAQAIMEKPDFLFLDEPTNAIDREGIQLIHSIIRQEANRGALVILATHIDQDVSALADVCYTMQKGEIVREE